MFVDSDTNRGQEETTQRLGVTTFQNGDKILGSHSFVAGDSKSSEKQFPTAVLFTDCLPEKIKADRSSKTSESIYPTTQRNVSEDMNPQQDLATDRRVNQFSGNHLFSSRSNE